MEEEEGENLVEWIPMKVLGQLFVSSELGQYLGWRAFWPWWIGKALKKLKIFWACERNPLDQRLELAGP
jgi:hypothetical protein